MKISIRSVLSLLVIPFAAVLFAGCNEEETEDGIASSSGGPICIGCVGGNTAALHGVKADSVDFRGVGVAAVELPDGRRFDATR